MRTPSITTNTVTELERQLDKRRDIARQAYVDLGERAYSGALLSDLALLVSLADQERRAVGFVLAEVRALEAVGYLAGARLTQAGREAAVAAAIARQEA